MTYQGTYEEFVLDSKKLGKPWNIAVYLPEGFSEEIAGDVNVFYLLVGAAGDYQSYEKDSTLFAALDSWQSAQGRPSVCIIPDGLQSFFVDGFSMDMESAIFEELIPQMEAKYGLHPDREHRIVFGNSMGGYAAARFGLLHPELFSRAVCLSPAVWYDLSPESGRKNFGVFVDAEGNTDAALWDGLHPENYLATYARAAEAGVPVRFFVSVGANDPAVPPADVERFMAALKDVAEVEYVKAPTGGHDWDFWNSAFAPALRALAAWER